MKAEINQHGVLMIYPESQTEVYAVKQWMEQACVKQEDVFRAERYHWRGSSLDANFTQEVR